MAGPTGDVGAGAVPVADAPPKMEVEEEDVTFSERAKIFRWDDGAWRERGIGNAQLRKGKVKGFVRMLLHDAATHTTCANFIVAPSLELKPNPAVTDNERTWIWVCLDYSEEKEVLSVFALRFKNAKIALQFKSGFDGSKEENRVAGRDAFGKSRIMGPAPLQEQDPKSIDGPHVWVIDGLG